jgi:DNA-binding IclR family transcriptional regulator
MMANAEHVIVFATQQPDHVRTLAEVMGLDRVTLDGYLRQLPRHGFVWYAARNQEVAICDPVRR